jgi:hypothetical protein
MTETSHNCIICAQEFNPDDLHNVKLSEINVTRYKICEACLNLSDPDDDYQSAKDIVNTYLNHSDYKFIPLKDKE